MASPTRRADGSTARREAVEAEVLRATEALLAEGASYAELNIERIAHRAGISRTAFYFYFRDKRELLLRLTQDTAEALYLEADRWWSVGSDAPREESFSGPEGLRRAVASIVGVYRRHGALLRAVVEAATYDEAVAEFFRALIGRFVDATRQRIESEQAAGRSVAMPAGETAFALVWMTERAIYQKLALDVAGDEDSPDGDAELLEALQGVWVRSVYGRPAD